MISEMPQKPVKGLVTDFHPLDQPTGTWRSALNVALSDTEFSGNLVSDSSDAECFDLGSGRQVCGHIPISNGQVVVFSKDGSSSYVGIADGCDYTELINSSCLGFDPCHKVTGTFKIMNGCERVITFCDGVNTDKYVNIDRLSDYETAGVFDCDKALLSAFTRVPLLQYDSTSIGGALPLGSYTFFVECLDADLNRIAVSNELAQVIIADDQDGGRNIEQVSATDGGVPLVDARIRVKVSLVPDTVRYLRLYANVFRTGDGVTFETFSNNILKEVSASVTYMDFNTLDAAYVTRMDATPLVVPQSFYETSLAHENVNNRLVRANPKEKTYDWSLFQREISKAVVNWKVEDVQEETNPIGAYNMPINNGVEFYIDEATFLADEVYSIFVRPVMKGGISGPQFHVPGRRKNVGAVWDEGTLTMTSFNAAAVRTAGNLNVFNRNTVPGTKDWDTQLLVVETATTSGTQIAISEVYQFGVTTVTTDIGYGLNANGADGTVGNTLIPRWLVFNTAISPASLSQQSGLMGYYECTELYPAVDTCDGNSYWGNDYWTNALLGQPIRHHRFPDTAVAGALWDLNTGTGVSKKRKISILVSNVLFPALYTNEVEYYEVCIGRRNDANKTVFDKGILYNAALYVPVVGSTTFGLSDIQKQLYLSEAFPLFGVETSFTYPSTGKYTSDNNYFITEGRNIDQQDPPEIIANATVFHSPRSKFYPDDHTGMYYKWEGSKRFDYISYNDNGTSERWTVFLGQEGAFVNGAADWYHRDISASKYIAPRSYDASGFNGLNSSVPYISTSDFVLINHARVFHSAVYAALKNDITLYTNSSAQITDTTGVSGNPQEANTQKCAYVSVKKVNLNCYSDLFNIDSIPLARVTGDKTYVDLNGDCFVNFFGFKKLAPSGQAHSNTWQDAKCQMRGVVFAAYESDINSELRYGTILPNSFYYPKNYAGFNGTFNFVLQSDNQIPYTTGIFYDDVEILSRYENAAEEEFRLNQDYQIVNRVDNTTNYNRFLDYCSDCYGKYPNRIIWSPVSRDESVSENWRTNFANDYLDIDAVGGDISGLWYNQNRLLVHAKDTTFFMAPNPQQLQVDQTNLYIGTGGFLSIPPESADRRNFGYGGLDQRGSVCDTPFGYCWADAKDGKIFLFRDQIQELSAMGNRNWFRDNMPIRLVGQLKELGYDYCCTENNSKNGVGISMVYDPQLLRTFVMKRDFELLYPNAFGGAKPITPPGTVVPFNLYIDATCNFVHWTGTVWQTIDKETNTYFKNLSWTISWSFRENCWVSWHSWLPSYAFSNSTRFLTFNDRKNGNSRVHGEKSFLSYDDEIWPSFIETISLNLSTFHVESVTWIGHSKTWDGTNNIWKEVPAVTFTGIMVYNEEQSTGKLTMQLLDQNTNPFGNIGWSATTKNVVRVNDEYRVSGLWDISDAVPNTSKAWADTQIYFDADGDGNGWIDLVPKNISATPNQFNLNFPRGKWVAVRMWFEPTDSSVGAALNINSTKAFQILR